MKKKTQPKSNKKTRRVVLLDAHAIIHRAYHALPDFSSAKGEPTGALYGLSAMLIKIVQELKPDYLLACYDLTGPTHRHDVYEAYKGTRKEIEDALVLQLNRSRDVFAAFGISVYEAPGFEADDVIGTIAKQLKKKTDTDVIIASGDMDTLQLVSDKRVSVYTLRKGIADTILYDEDAVHERFGFSPALLPDYKGLCGDPSDNIKGITGIGEKTATALVSQFGTVEDIYKVLKRDPEALIQAGIKKRVLKLLAEGEDNAVFSKMLATIRTDAPISISLSKKTWSEELLPERVLSLFDELGFRTLSERVKVLFRIPVSVKESEEREQVDPAELEETAVALWVLHSDTTSPTYDDILRFAGADSFKGARAFILKQLKEEGRSWEVFEKIEKPLIPVVKKMSLVGIGLDCVYLKALSKKYHAKLAQIGGQIYARVGREFNINSPKQLGGVLFDELGLSLPRHKKTGGGARSTRESELEKLKGTHPIIDEVLSYRELQKLLSTYVDALPSLVGGDGRLHAQFRQAGTTTGRMSSQNPNLQNIPIRTELGKNIRNAFVAREGSVLAALDYSQIELRIATALSGDKKLTRVFEEGGDVHTAVAAEVFSVPSEEVDAEMRRRAKIINFGILYGMGVNALRVNLGEEVTRNEASAFLQNYFRNFSGLAHYIEMVKHEAAQRGFTETLLGRRRYFAGFDSSLPQVKAQAERMAINAPIQGTSADIIKLAMVRIDEEIERRGLGKDARLVLQVHDELVYEVARTHVEELVPEIARIMETVVSPEELSGVPLIVERSVGKNWGEMEKMRTSP